MTRAKDISKILTDADISGNIDVDGVTNLDVVDIDGAVDMASTLNVTGALTGTTSHFTSTGQVAKFESSNNGLQVEFNYQNNTSRAFMGTFSNGLSLAPSSASTAINIDSSGHVTMPLQPAFQAHKNGTAQNNFATGGANVVFSAERFDNNADFDLTNNRFVAPVTGKYFLNITLRLDFLDIDAGYYQLILLTSNINYHFILTPKFSADLQYFAMSHSVVADMDAGDTASISIEQNGGSAQTDIPGSNGYTHFSGYLVA